jgi:lauroyl/myristoyl acyltransferase
MRIHSENGGMSVSITSMAPEDLEPAGLFRWGDIRKLSALGLGALVSAPLPERWDPATAELLFRLHRAAFPREIGRLQKNMARALPGHSPSALRGLAEAHIRMRLEDMWGRVRGIRRFGWNPAVELEGLDRVHEALGRGRGVILWSMRFASATAIKQAFHGHGVPLVHLSREEHGAGSKTKLAVRVVSPLFCRAENPYLAERIRIPLDGSVRYVETVKRRLRANACVSIFGEHQGRQNAEAEVLGARFRFALGAPSLAWSERAALFTVHALRTAPFEYRVVAGEEIPVDRSAPRKAFAGQAAAEFARRLEKLILEHPADWQGWSYRNF